MMRWYEWVLIFIICLFVAIVFAPSRPPAPKPDQRIERLEAKVADLTVQMERIEGKADACLSGVATVDGRLTLEIARRRRLESVVPVQAIRDRSKVK